MHPDAKHFPSSHSSSSNKNKMPLCGEDRRKCHRLINKSVRLFSVFENREKTRKWHLLILIQWNFIFRRWITRFVAKLSSRKFGQSENDRGLNRVCGKMAFFASLNPVICIIESMCELAAGDNFIWMFAVSNFVILCFTSREYKLNISSEICIGFKYRLVWIGMSFVGAKDDNTFTRFYVTDNLFVDCGMIRPDQN